MSTRTNIKPENNLVSILHYELHSCIRVDYKGQTQIPWTTFYMLLAKKNIAWIWKKGSPNSKYKYTRKPYLQFSWSNLLNNKAIMWWVKKCVDNFCRHGDNTWWSWNDNLNQLWDILWASTQVSHRLMLYAKMMKTKKKEIMLLYNAIRPLLSPFTSHLLSLTFHHQIPS